MYIFSPIKLILHLAMFHILFFSVDTEPYAIKRDCAIGSSVCYCSETPRPAVDFDYSKERRLCNQN